MSLLVTGSIGIDTVKTPFGVSKDCLGGSAVYFSMAASFFSPVRFLGTIGADCPFDLKKIFKGRKVDLNGLELRHKSKTFRWAGSYQGTMNEAITEFVELNVLAENPPQMPEEYKDSKFVFLANTAPILQIQLLDQLHKPKFVAADTMNLWINNNLADLKRLMKKIDCLILNETEARMLANEHNLITAAAKIEKLGPSVVVIKKGESGSIIHVSRASSPRKRGQACPERSRGDGRDTCMIEPDSPFLMTTTEGPSFSILAAAVIRLCSLANILASVSLRMRQSIFFISRCKSARLLFIQRFIVSAATNFGLWSWSSN
jgi:sugar/nucleoside kinase (ribokinase family)